MTTTMAYHAASRGIEIEAIDTESEGDIDLRGFLGLSDKIRKGYQNIRVRMRVKSTAKPDALMGCMTTTMAYHAASRGIEIEAIDTESEGDIDLRGFLGLSDKIRKGYQNIRVRMRVKSTAKPETLRELATFSFPSGPLSRSKHPNSSGVARSAILGANWPPEWTSKASLGWPTSSQPAAGIRARSGRQTGSIAAQILPIIPSCRTVR